MDKRTRILLPSHATAFIVGAILVSHPAWLPFLSKGSAKPSFNASATSENTNPAGSVANLTGRGLTQTEAFRQAWTELSLRPVSRAERLAAQKNLLREWAKTDLQGAIDAALGEGWNKWWDFDNSRHLLDGLRDVFKDHFEEAWRIASRENSPLSKRLLQDHLLQRCQGTDPKKVLSLLGEMSPEQRRDAIAGLSSLRPADSDPGGKKQRSTILEGVLRSGLDQEQVADLIISRSLVPANATTDWIDQPQTPERTAGLISWATALAGNPDADLASALAGIPERDRLIAIKAALKTLDSNSPDFLPLLNDACSAGQWELLNNLAIEKFQSLDPFSPSGASTPQTTKAIEWAGQLPDRLESSLFLSNLLGNLGNDDPVWSSFPEHSWSRDVATSIKAQRAMGNGNNDEVERLITTIEDPVRRGKAEANIRRYQMAQEALKP